MTPTLHLRSTLTIFHSRVITTHAPIFLHLHFFYIHPRLVSLMHAWWNIGKVLDESSVKQRNSKTRITVLEGKTFLLGRITRGDLLTILRKTTGKRDYVYKFLWEKKNFPLFFRGTNLVFVCGRFSKSKWLFMLTRSRNRSNTWCQVRCFPFESSIRAGIGILRIIERIRSFIKIFS